MKNYWSGLLLLGLLATSCEKEPDLNKLDVDFTVYTNYDPNMDFTQATTYYLPDSILTAGSNTGIQASYWSDENAQKLVSQITSEMNQRGYVRSEKKSQADLGIQVTYVDNTIQLVGTVGGYWDGWWMPGYWGPYWGGGWYYPFPITYQYNTGSIVLELVDLQHADSSRQDQPLPIVWQAISHGLLSGNGRYDLTLIQRAIQQSFEQSSYLIRQGKKE